MTPLEQALTNLASTSYWLSWVATLLIPVVIIATITLFILILRIRSLKHKAQE